MLNIINYNFKTELTKERTIYTDIVFTTGDVKGYHLSFNFTNNGKPVSIKSYVMTVKAKRADGIVVTDAGIINDEYTAYYDVKNSMICVPGEVSFEIALADNTGMYVTTKELIANVREGYGNEDITGYDTAPVISSLLSAASTLGVSADIVNEAVNNANEAADNANEAADNANQAADNANQAADNANAATDNANLAAGNANTATESAVNATESANRATEYANIATETANQAAENTNTAITNANQAIENMNQVAENYEPFIVNIVINDDMTDVISASAGYLEIYNLIVSEHRPVIAIVKTESYKDDKEVPPTFVSYMECIGNFVGFEKMVSYTHTEALMVSLLCNFSFSEGPIWHLLVEELATTKMVEEAMESVIEKYGLGGDSV